MKIEAGKYYRTRRKQIFGPMRRRDNMTTYPWGDGYDCWTDSGRVREDVENCDMDLISEVYVSDTPPADEPAPETKTLRDEFAMAALTGLLANAVDDGSMGAEDWASDAYLFADKMMEARKK